MALKGCTSLLRACLFLNTCQFPGIIMPVPHPRTWKGRGREGLPGTLPSQKPVPFQHPFFLPALNTQFPALHRVPPSGSLAPALLGPTKG